MFKYSLVAVAMIFIAVACNKKEEATMEEAAPMEQMEAAPADAGMEEAPMEDTAE